VGGRGGSPGAARVWGSLPGSAAALNRAAWLGTRGRPGCTGGGVRYAATARTAAGAPAFGFGRQPKLKGRG
jgi:hypothetical protein